MTLSKDRIGALLFLALSIAYGYYASQIRLFPGEELESMTSRTLPLVLAGLGGVLSLGLLVLGSGDSLKDSVQSRLHWSAVALLILLTFLYGIALDYLGFIVSTILFLITGFRVLGERRLKVLLGVAIPFVLVFWFGLTQLLDIYLAPGRLFAAWLQ